MSNGALWCNFAQVRTEALKEADASLDRFPVPADFRASVDTANRSSKSVCRLQLNAYMAFDKTYSYTPVSASLYPNVS